MTDIDLTHHEHRAGEHDSQQLAPALPLAAVAGLRGKSTVVWLVNSMLQSAGRSVALWSSTGVYVNGERQEGELGPWGRALEALQAGQLDVAVQELETSTVTSVGLPQRIYPVAAVTTLCGNNEDCLISPEAAQGARAVAMLARAVRPDGDLVLNADDGAVRAAADMTTARVILYALHPENPALRRHLERGGCGVWADDGRIVLGTRMDQRGVIAIDAAHFTLGGALTFQVQNLLCAVAIAAALQVPDEAIRRAVSTFEPDPNRLPGSCNIIRLSGATLVIDGAHQVWTLRSLVRGIRHQPHRRMVTVSGCFPHLSEPQLIEAGRLLGRLGGAVILHALPEQRGMVDAMIEGISQNDIPPLVLSMPSEHEAIVHALRMLREGDFGLVVTGDAQGAAETIWAIGA